MTRWLLRLYPVWFRDRYGPEITDVIARSDHRFRDVVDVIVHAGQLRWRDFMSHLPRHVASSAVIIAVLVLGYTLNDLEGGIRDIPRHWWSSLALGGTVVSVVARALLGVAESRRHRPSAP